MAQQNVSFVSDQRGGITPFILIMFTGIVLMTGIALDLVRFEAERADLQDALDRGVLAAASLDQTQSPQATVDEYVRTRALSDRPVDVTVSPVETLNYRRIGAAATQTMNTFFLNMVGTPTLTVAGGAAAEQQRQHVEISLVLDISGSMARERSGGTSASRLQVLRGAASDFVDLILTPETVTTTSLSLVPFSGQVNAGILFDRFNNSRVHNYASCIEFTDSDYNTTALPGANSRAQVPHFQWFRFEGYYGHEADWGWCPDDNEALVPLSNDATALKAEIARFRGHDGTGTQNGMKWGLGLLDPGSSSMVSSLISSGQVSSDFSGRPAAFNDSDALKVIVLMTDGNIRYQQRPRSWAYDSASERNYWASRYLSSSYATLSSSSKRTSDEAFRRTQFRSLCSLAKQNGVIVFTIGFDVSTTSTAYSDMRDCASSQGHFYHVEGLELGDAFRQIAGTIQKLKLVE